MELTYRGKTIKSVGIFGLGKSGVGVEEYIRRHHPDVKIKRRSDVPSDKAEFCGERALCDISEDLLFLSPSVRRDRAGLAEAETRGVVMTSDAEFFEEKYRGKLFTVTGSDGKSTTATLASRMLACKGRTSAAIGNIGVAMTPCLDSNFSAVVAELSSFQLMGFTPKSARALITNVTPNHLNWHVSYEEYEGAKKNVMVRAKERVFNLDDPVCRKFADEYGADIAYSYEQSERELRNAIDASVYVTLCDGNITANGRALLPINKIRCSHKHNIKNFIAAVALTYGYADAGHISDVAKEFRGLEHRCELVGVFDGVTYLNSSIDSSPLRTATTLDSLNKRAIVILGGRSKGLSLKDLGRVLRCSSSLAILTGENGREIMAALDPATPAIYEGDFEQAVLTAIDNARCGDTVILSPASTSFDRFTSFEERGNKFKEIILNHYRGS